MSEPEKVTVLTAVSGEIDATGATSIALWWTPAVGTTGYNLYRSSDGMRRFKRVNDRPIVPVSTGAELEVLVERDTAEWDLLTNAFTGVAGRARFRLKPDAIGRARVVDRSALLDLRGLAGLDLSRPEARSLHIRRLVDPGDALARGLTVEEVKAFDALAHSNFNLRRARGLAFLDRGVVAGTRYGYELRGIAADGSEFVLARWLDIIAGLILPPDPPSGLTCSAGDHRVLLLWNRNPHAKSYAVRRSVSPYGPFRQVNAAPIAIDIANDLNGDAIDPAQPGFVDIQRWDEDGIPVDHEVNGLQIAGPTNGTTYYYKVASVDVLNRTGSWSDWCSAKPMCSTAPMAPHDVRADATISALALTISWRKVKRDTAGHPLEDAYQVYRIYRASTQVQLEDVANLGLLLLASVTADAADPTTPTLSWDDIDPILVPPFGEQDFWYRIVCEDSHGHASAPSAIVRGRIPDIRPPGPTPPTGAESHDGFIRIFWDANTEPDLSGYQVWRGICDFGTIYSPENREGIECEFVLVGSVSVPEGQARREETGSIYFDDHTVPAGSPICYAYWVRGYDASQNLYDGDRGCPAAVDEYVCQRLYEEVAPPAPIVTALRARSDGVLISWIGSPVQDLRAFHVYRGDNEQGPPSFVACVLNDGTVLSQPYVGMKPNCADIPAEANPLASKGWYLDGTAEPNRIYWYRVSALDWLGNESEAADLNQLPAMSTFTYSRRVPTPPIVMSPVASAVSGCGLVVRWQPTFDPGALDGFIVFRGVGSTGAFRQVSALVEGNHFTDVSARRDVDYWYRVQAMDRRGSLSPASTAIHHRY